MFPPPLRAGTRPSSHQATGLKLPGPSHVVPGVLGIPGKESRRILISDCCFLAMLLSALEFGFSFDPNPRETPLTHPRDTLHKASIGLYHVLGQAGHCPHYPTVCSMDCLFGAEPWLLGDTEQLCKVMRHWLMGSWLGPGTRCIFSPHSPS